MLAFLLAAGSGARLRPITDSVPKCLIPIAGKPLISYTLDLLALHGVTKVLINGHHLYEQVAAYLATTRRPFEITVSYEPTLLGSAGTLRANRQTVINSEDFLVIYADNLTDANLSQLRAHHRRSGKLATIALFRTPTPAACGIVTLDSHGVVVDFQEKPKDPRSNLAFAGLMAASPALLDEIPDTVPCDLARDVLPKLRGRIGGWEVTGYLRDIGTPESYQQAQAEVLLLYRSSL
jgi:mannose-1-phosphate guanylyltransferase